MAPSPRDWAAGAVLISSKHNDEAVLRRPLVGPVHGWLARLTDRVIVLSEHVGRYMRDRGSGPVRASPPRLLRHHS